MISIDNDADGPDLYLGELVLLADQLASHHGLADGLRHAVHRVILLCAGQLGACLKF